MSTPPPPPQTFKILCIKCHTSRPLHSLLDRMCCWFFIDVLLNYVFAFAFLFFVVSKVLSFLLVLLLIFFFFFMFFSGSRSGACSVSNPGLLAKYACIAKYACFNASNTYLLIQKSSLSFTLTDSFSSVVSGASSRSHLNVACRG